MEITILGIGHVVLGLLLSLDVLLTKHRPVSAVLWLAVVWAWPYLGALFYLTIGMDRVRRGAAARQAAKRLVAQRTARRAGFDRLAIDYTRPGDGQPTGHPAQHIFRFTDPAVRPNRVLLGNRVQLLVDGDEFYPSLFEAIESAESSVHLQTFIYARDRIGGQLLDLLSQRAREGIECRLLYDRFGSTLAHLTRFFEGARRAGVKVCSITQANPLKGRFQINLRNHRKIAIIDGRVGFAGGINISDKNYTQIATARDSIRDYHTRIEGPAISDLQVQFVEDWHFASREAPESLLGDSYFPQLPPAGDALVQIVPGGPELKGHGLADAFFGAIVAAETSISIVTPYFVPDEPIVQALRYAALRGVDVRLVLPRHSNHWYTGFAARALYTPLLKSGVRIFERGPPFIHAKALVVDRVYAMIGSANLDHRSMYLNFETNVEVADHDFVGRVSQQIESEIAESDEVSAARHEARSLTRKLAENFCFLFQPML
ncbi:MAG: cardiolipin synthase [Gemmatimonadota bacterium]|nr:MAG: cardiolipin synthase [Gemmatimonadota bacterium]